MQCPHCAHEITKVVESRTPKSKSNLPVPTGTRLRIRKCTNPACAKRFQTLEQPY